MVDGDVLPSSSAFDLAGLTQVDLDPVASGVQKVPGGAEGFVFEGFIGG
jgi:hypothetical protein